MILLPCFQGHCCVRGGINVLLMAGPIPSPSHSRGRAGCLGLLQCWAPAFLPVRTVSYKLPAPGDRLLVKPCSLHPASPPPKLSSQADVGGSPRGLQHLPEPLKRAPAQSIGLPRVAPGPAAGQRGPGSTHPALQPPPPQERGGGAGRSRR